MTGASGRPEPPTDRPEPATDRPEPVGDRLAAKPTAAALGIDLDGLDWRRSGSGDGAIEVAFARDPASREVWVLVRVCGDESGRILVYDRHEWDCFLDGVRSGEFDPPAG
jgi:hypothetical protein